LALGDGFLVHLDIRVISIGALACHPLRGEQADMRPGHATTTLIRTDDACVLVDPALPPEHLLPRLDERAGIRPSEITHVFLTDLRPDRRRGLPAFTEAEWLTSECERDAYGEAIHAREQDSIQEPEILRALEAELALIARCGAAPDHMVKGVDLFPLPGVTPGLCGLLLPTPRATVLVCGDAVATLEHLQSGKVLPHLHNLEQAHESFKEAIEIADVLIPGRDNIVPNPLRPMSL
jgi:glyoxylase-like metal-dependent hydrolase (beta-lactamase superfamily II)